MERIMTKLVRFVKDESGATAIEYGLIAAAIGLMLVVAMPLLSTALKAVFSSITGALNTASGS
jgi:pilus assembly protein Flp/PilA